MAALIVGTSGIILSLLFGTYILQIPFGQVLISIVASNLIGLAALVISMRAQAVAWLRENVLTRSMTTWALISVLYFAPMLGMIPWLRDWKVFAWMAFPLLMCTGFIIVWPFGMIQDYFVRKSQRKVLKTRVNEI